MMEARNWASISKDPSRRIGAVAIIDRNPVASGYNGFPSYIEDKPEFLNNREEKYKRTIHAELNCLINASKKKQSLVGSVLYVYGLPVCENCAIIMIGAGVKEIIYCDINSSGSQWVESGNISKMLFEESGVVYREMSKKDLDIYMNKCYIGL